MRTYRVRKDLQLLYDREPCDKPVLTVANYKKWYEMYLVRPDGTVQEVGFGELEMVANGRAPYVDHVPCPEVVAELCEARDWYFHAEAHQMMVGRWELEVM